MNLAPLLTILLLLSPLAGHAQVVEERTTVVDGDVRTCGVGDDLNPCRDVNGETYQEEISGPDIQSKTDSELAAKADKIRNESPEELSETIKDMEDDARY